MLIVKFQLKSHH